MRLDRLNSMEQYILQQGTVSLEDLASHFQVSTNTIRRDLNELLDRGHIEKVYGGVSSLSDPTPLPLSIRTSKNSISKQVIGELAARMVNDGDTIFLDSGSTTPHILPHIANKQNITIVTHSLSAMYEASKYPTLKVIALGGMYNIATSSYVGISTLEALSCISISAVFIAATGVSLERGLTNTTYFEAEIKRKVVHSSNKIILMADHSKFDDSSTITFFDFKDLFAVVTDQKPTKPYMDVIQRNNIRLLYSDIQKAPQL
ncbi:DeoR/GlpR family DNA-binding transcription regulator [Lachnospiraceae bacterium LCP25S3_G4]